MGVGVVAQVHAGIKPLAEDSRTRIPLVWHVELDFVDKANRGRVMSRQYLQNAGVPPPRFGKTSRRLIIAWNRNRQIVERQGDDTRVLRAAKDCEAKRRQQSYPPEPLRSTHGEFLSS